MGREKSQISKDASIERCVYINVPALRVWEALTSRASIDEYFILPTCCLELSEGGKISFGVDGDEIILGSVESVQAPTQFIHTFSFAHFPEDKPSTVCYTIEEIGPELSCLYLHHKDLILDSSTHNDVKFGWDRILSEMKSCLETGRGLNWPEQ